MGLFLFLKNAGEKLSHKGEVQPQADADSLSPRQIHEYEKHTEQAILHYIALQNLSAEALMLRFDSASATVTVSGKAHDLQTWEKIILCCGNVEGVERVDDQMQMIQGEAEHSEWYMVQRGDTLAEISQKFYGDANKYMNIYEANQPMLIHPDRLYVGQMLRVPPGTRKCFEPTVLWRKNRHNWKQS